MTITVNYTDGSFVEYKSYKNTKFTGSMRDYENPSFDNKIEDVSLAFFLDFAFETVKTVKACYLSRCNSTENEYVNNAFNGELLTEWEQVTRQIRKAVANG